MLRSFVVICLCGFLVEVVPVVVVGVVAGVVTGVVASVLFSEIEKYLTCLISPK